MSFCLPKFAADALIGKLPEDISKLTDMTSSERRKFFADIVGPESAREINAQFESKLLLKDQQQGIINWVKKVTGMTPEAKRDLISKVNNMKEVLQPKDEQAFLEDLAAHKLGMGVTIEEAGRIADLAKQVEDTKAAMATGGDRLAYGRANVAFHNYVNGLKLAADRTPWTDYLKPKNALKGIVELAGQSKGIVASGDLSALLRQGGKALWTNPGAWAENALKSIGDAVKTLGGKEVIDEMNAEIISRPTYEQMRKAKLDVGTAEEQFPTAAPEKIPLFGRVFKASNVAFTSFVHRLRADIFDTTLEIAEKSGIDVNDRTQLESIGKMVNSLTGRGSLGRAEPVAGMVNNIFFSPRFLKSQFDVLTAHQFQKDVTPFVRKRAAINLVKILAGQAAVQAIANTINSGSADKDPHGSGFGKIKVKGASTLSMVLADALGVSANKNPTTGITTFDYSTGEGSLITLGARLLPLIAGQPSYTKSVAGKVSPLNSGNFGSQTGYTVLTDFAAGKASPAVSALVLNRLLGKDFDGNKPDLPNTLKNLFVPITITNMFKK